MARFGYNDADNYGNNGTGSSFFQLKNHKDAARVRFLYRTLEDVEGYAVHKVAVGDKERYVNCLREYNEPLDKCPFCKAGLKVQPKLFVKLYNEDAQEVQIWERGKTFFKNLSGFASRYNPLCNKVIEIERDGQKGDMQTRYNFYPSEEPMNDFDLDSVEVSDPIGTIILDKTADDMNYYLDHSSFPTDSQAVANARSSRATEDEVPWDNRDGGVTRRTPSNRRSF